MGNPNYKAYDDAYHTICINAPELMRPLLNRTFGEGYNPGDAIRFSQNEHYITLSDGTQKKRITDHCFSVNEGRLYVYECQCSGGITEHARFFEYVIFYALEKKQIGDRKISVPLPEAAVLQLRRSTDLGNEVNVEIRSRKETWIYPIRVFRMWEIGADAIIRQKLYILIPFYVFSKDGIGGNALEKTENADGFLRGYGKLRDMLCEGVREHEIDEYAASLIKAMVLKVIRQALRQEENQQTRREIEHMFSGEELMFPAKHFMLKGMQQGLQQGMQRGLQQGLQQGMQQGLQQGRDLERANTERERKNVERERRRAEKAEALLRAHGIEVEESRSE